MTNLGPKPTGGRPGSAFFCGGGTWSDELCPLLLDRPGRVLTAATAEEVPGLLDQIEDEQGRGNFVAGYVSYEAGGAFGLATHAASDLVPLAWMRVYPLSRVQVRLPAEAGSTAIAPSLVLTGEHLNVGRAEYDGAIRKIREYIAAGDSYQVNYTCHARFDLDVDPGALFSALLESHPVPYAAYLDLGDAQILSLSPELFLSRRGRILESRPMKGTISRGRTLEEDALQAHTLAASEKERAENLMITDMVRNDLGRVCRVGSLRWPSLFAIERYRSLFQMTSTVVGEMREDVRLRDVFAAAFPGASVTGAPKHRTMEIIRELEPEPRGVYTGAICLFLPGGDFTCSLAIRTLVHRSGLFDLGLGGGIVWDSRAESEYEEVLLKSRFLSNITPSLRLLETMLLDDSRTYRFVPEHFARLRRSAEYWGFPFDERSAGERMTELAKRGGPVPAAVRLDLRADGTMSLGARRLSKGSRSPARLLLAECSTDSGDRFLYHKTNRRATYDNERERALASGFFEVIFRNERGCLTEGAITNLFARFGDRWRTPPVADGLLPGIWRESFARQVNAEERSITVEELKAADAIVIGNSVRGCAGVEEVWKNGEPIWPPG